MDARRAQGSCQSASDFDLSESVPDFDPPGTCSNAAEAYGPPSKWEFRPPHPIEAGTVITEMDLESGPSRAIARQ